MMAASFPLHDNPTIAVASREIPLCADWEMASTAKPATPTTLNRLNFIPAKVPGTVASVLHEHSVWRMGDRTHFDASEHWFRCRFDVDPVRPGEEIVLRFGGIATVSEVWLNGQEILKSNSMFASHEVEVTALIGESNELLIVCRSLTAAMRERRRQTPLARWRTRVVTEQSLRWFRTTLLGRAPGFAPEPEPVGPWRPVTLVRRSGVVVERWTRQAKLDGSTGVIDVHLQVRSLQPGIVPRSGRLITGDAEASFDWLEQDSLYHGRAVLSIPNALPWWPHTHGLPAMYPLRAELQLADGSTTTFEDVPVGFRSIDAGAEPAGDGRLALKVNGTSVFCRGVVWIPPDIATLAAPSEVVRKRLRLLRDGGFNLIRLAGTTIYECEEFHRLCDELGLMVWQDLMFANLDYPFDDPDFCATVRAETEAELSRLARHPSSTILCGNSEIEQQVGMLGLSAEIGRGFFFGQELPRAAARYCPGIPYIPSAPCGGDQPFRTRSGVANYFGVGAYLRPFEDIRRSEVRFASECLAFSNVPEPDMLEEISRVTPGGFSPNHPAWKRSVPRDQGADWDFEDVRDHYLKLLYSVDPAVLRLTETSRYCELSRMASGETMAEVFGEWRRAASPCGGGIVLWSADLEPGAGWGILDSRGQPKAAYWFLKRTLAPCAVWTTDEGLNGVDIHVANDRSETMNAWLRVALFPEEGPAVAESDLAVNIAKHTTVTFGLEQILGRFVDASYAYRFGPPGHVLIVVSLRSNRGDIPFAHSFRFPAGRPNQPSPIDELGIEGQAIAAADGTIEMLLSARRFAWGVRASASGLVPNDSYFGIEPGGIRRIVLTPLQNQNIPASIALTAVNGQGRISIAVERVG